MFYEKFAKKVKHKIQKLIMGIIKIINILRYEKVPFVIISNNCWGGELYRSLNIKYNSPFIGLYIYAPCYIKMLKDFQNYMLSELKFTVNSKYIKDTITYPIGLLKNEVEIHFVHYKNEGEAKDKWERRKKRMSNYDFDSLFFKFCDRDECAPKLLEDFHNLPYKNKVSFSATKYKDYKNNYVVNDSNKQQYGVPDGKVLFNISHYYFDIIYWINKKQIKMTNIQKILNKLYKLAEL